MANLKAVLFMFLFLSFIATPSHAFWWMGYHKPAFQGKVIDAETKKPIEGAVVVAIYKKYPIISGPGGGSQSIMDIKEILTNAKGEFYFPSYTTLIQPFSIEGSADFIIFKPGYGSFPDWRVNPPKMWLHDVPPGNSKYWDRNLSFEEFFSSGVGSLKELWASEPWGTAEKPSQKINLTMGVVELPPLKTREERLKVSESPADSVSWHKKTWYWKKQKHLIKLLREEYQYLYGQDASDLYRWEED